ncbi:esterase/lipase family protein, partial [Aspergillus candidus]
MDFLRKALKIGGHQQKNQIPPSPEDNQAESSRSSAQVSPSLSFPAGVEVWYDCCQPTVDICFVHGLNGHRSNTWTAEGQSTPWPKKLLPDYVSGARILTYGYDAHVVRRSVASQSDLRDHALNLLNDLTSDRNYHNASSRPIIFVAHSLGGLLCKLAILQSRNDPDYLTGIFDCTKGVIFMGTPHKGSWMATLSLPAAIFLGLVKSTTHRLLELLKKNNQYLTAIQSDFWSMMRKERERGRRLEATCFYEELPLPGLGVVVLKESATADGYNQMGIHANHNDMVRFNSADDNGFKRLCGVLSKWKNDICSSQERQNKRHYSGADERPLKKRRTRYIAHHEESDDSDESKYEGSNVFDETDCSEDDSTEQPTQNSLEMISSEHDGGDESDTSDENHGVSQDTGADDEEDIFDDFAPF